MIERTINLDTVVENRSLGDDNRKDTTVLDNPETDVAVEEQPDENQEQQYEQNQESEQEEQVENQEQETQEVEYQDPMDEIPDFQEQQQEQDEEIDLNDLTVDQNGAEISVSAIIEERNELYARAQEIDKDPFLKGFLEFYKSGGDVTQYLEAKATNWDGVGDLDVLRRTFNKENSDLNPSVREKLFKKELERKYGFDPESVSEEDAATDDFKIAQELIKRDAFKTRESMKTEQQKFSIPKKEQVDPVVQREAIQKQVMANKEVRDFLNNKLVRIDVPVDGQYFAYQEQNPQAVVEMIVDGNKFWNKLLDKDGKVDWNKANKVLSYAMNPAAFETELIKLGQRQGRREKIMQDRNIDGRLNQNHNGAAVNNGEKSEKDQILGAFLSQKRSKK